MNAVEFKKGIEENKVKNIDKFLADYKEEWGETIEDSIDELLEKYITDGNTDEPLIIDTIKSGITREYGEWQDVNKFEYNNKEIFGDSPDYQYQSYFVLINKRKMFRNAEVNVKKYRKRIQETYKHYIYDKANEAAQAYIKKIFKNKEFLVEDIRQNIHSGFYNRHSKDCLFVYWNYDKIEE